jgi:CheY-like chemotaxis protein
MKHCLIDDSRVVRTVAPHPGKLSYSAAECGDGFEGVKAIAQHQPDLIFLDWNLSEMKGLEFIKSGRGQREGAHPVILFSATERDPDEMASAFAAGANELVQKPFDVSLMRAKLEICASPSRVAFPDQRLSA